MTATATRVPAPRPAATAGSPGPVPPVAPAPVTGTTTRGRILAPWAGMVAGGVLLAVAYSLAETRPDATDLRYLLLLAGLGAFGAPALWRLLDPDLDGLERSLLCWGVALFTAVPKLLRNQGGPLFYDELAHWNQSERLLDTGQLLSPNALVRILDAYPGLHSATVALARLTGLEVWPVATLVIVASHVLAVLGIQGLARRLLRDRRVGGVAGFLYALNPAFLFFDSQFAYQTLAIAFLVTALALVTGAGDRLPPGTDARSPAARNRAGQAALAGVMGMAVCVTHHVTGFITVGLLTALAVAATRRARRDPTLAVPARLLRRTAVAVGVFAVVWMVVGTRGDPFRLFAYLERYPSDGLQELLNLGRQGNSRTIFAAGGLPGWMPLTAFVAPPLAVGLGALGWWAARRRGGRASGPGHHPLYATFVVMAGVYAASMPFVLTRTGAEPAHRSFPFSWIGLSLLAAVGLVSAANGLRRLPPLRRLAATAAVGAGVLVLGVGNLASDINDYYLFPGPWAPGSDTRAFNRELAQVAAWFRTQNPDKLAITDYFTGAAVAAIGDRNPGCRLAAACELRTEPWLMYFQDDLDADLLGRYQDSGFGWIVVDRRMAENPPRTGFWFNKSEPGAYTDQYIPIPTEHLLRFEGKPWAHRVLATEHYDVYRLDFTAYGRPVDLGQGPPAPAGFPPGTAGPVDAPPPSPPTGPAVPAPPPITAAPVTTARPATPRTTARASGPPPAEAPADPSPPAPTFPPPPTAPPPAGPPPTGPVPTTTLEPAPTSTTP